MPFCVNCRAFEAMVRFGTLKRLAYYRGRYYCPPCLDIEMNRVEPTCDECGKKIDAASEGVYREAGKAWHLNHAPKETPGFDYIRYSPLEKSERSI
jgi:hypothetical protein